MSASGESLPDELPLDDEAPPAQPPNPYDEDLFGDFLSQSLPLSDEEPCNVGAGSSALGELSIESPQDDAAAQEEVQSGGEADSAQPRPKQQSLRARPGRPDHALLEALADAQALVEVEEGARRQGGDAPLQPLARPTQQATAQLDKALVQRTALARDTLDKLLPKSIGGFNLEFPLEGPVMLAQRLASTEGVDLDTEVQRIGSHFLDQHMAAITSKRVVCEALLVDERKLDRVLPRLAAVVSIAERAKRRQLENNLVDCIPPEDRLLYVDCVAYDETPLAVALRGQGRSLRFAPATQDPEAKQVAVDAGMASFSRGPTLQITTSATTQKILQHMQTGGMLLKVKDRFVIIKMHTLSNLAVMENGTKETLMECQLRLSTATRSANCFEHQARVACTDGAKTNIACEKAFARGRGAQCMALHYLCDIHKTSLMHEKCFVLLDANIRGMIKCALSLRSGAAMNIFRRCLAQEIEDRLEILHGRPSQEAVAYKQAVLRLVVSRGRNLAIRRVLLALCPNGDWRSPRVQYFVPPGPTASSDKAIILEHMVAGLVTALCATKPQVYPQSRWTGCDLATDDLCVIEACHGLLSGAYKRFVVSFQPNLARLFTQQAAPAAGAVLAEPVLGGGDEHEAMDGDGGAEGSARQALVETAEQGAPETAKSSADWARVNAARRRDGAKWVSADPFGHMVLQRLLMEPLRQLMTAQFEVASAEWEKEQQCKAAAAMQKGEVDFRSRDYRLVIAATGRDDMKFKEQLGLLWKSPVLWQLIPERCYNISFRGLSFRCLSRLACTHKQLMALPHESFPIRLFKLLESPDLAPSMAATPACLLGPWATDMKRQHPDFEGEIFRHKLLLFALLGAKDISVVESRHATIRRILTIASTQTHRQDFADLAAFWFLLQARTRASDFAPWQTKKHKKGLQRRAAKAKRQSTSRPSKVCGCVWGGRRSLFGVLFSHLFGGGDPSRASFAKTPTWLNTFETLMHGEPSVRDPSPKTLGRAGPFNPWPYHIN